MRNITIFAIVLLAGLPALAQNRSATINHTLTMHKVHRNFTLEQRVFTRTHRLKSLLQPRARKKLDLVIRRVLKHLASGSKNIDLSSLAQQEVRKKFTRISNKQSDLLSFYVLGEVAQILTVPNELKSKLDGMNEMSEMTSLRLQMMMDRRSKFISTLSNIMKKISTTQDTLVQNLK